MLINRRAVIGISAVAAACLLGLTSRANAPLAKRRPTPQIPRWRGFNLTELAGWGEVRPFFETDFKWISEFGFDFVRLPLSYWSWSSPDNWMHIDEGVLKLID